MQATRARALVSYAVISSSAALICCGNDEAPWLNATPRGELVGGERNLGVAGQGAGGSGQSTAGSGGMLTLGGSSSTPAGGAGEGGTLPSEAGTGAAMAGGESAGGAGPREEQLGFCARLDAQTRRVGATTMAYTKPAYDDCDTHWIMRIPVDQKENVAFRNGLTAWSYNLWGCQDSTPVNRFGLVWETPKISAGDAQRLIDIYVAAADEQANLSPGEEAELRAALARLSRLVIADPSLEPSRPNSNPKCQGASGAGGADGTGGAGGAGGADGTGGAGGAGASGAEEPGSAGHGGAP